MILQVFAVRDRQVDAYMRPFFTQSVGSAVRGFTTEVNRSAQDNPLWLYPDDHDLYHIGEFDDGSGKFKLLEAPLQVAVGKNVAVR